MPVDGTFGRFSAHNQRARELRQRKLDQRQQSLQQNKLKSAKASDTKSATTPPSKDNPNIKRSNLIQPEISTKLTTKEIIIYTIGGIGFFVIFYFCIAFWF